MMLTEVPESKTSLTSVVVALLVWAAHFLLSYATAAIWCAKVAGPAGSFAGAQLVIGLYTALALAAVGLIGGRAWRDQHVGDSDVPDDCDTVTARQRFLAFSTLLAAGFSAIAIVYTALAAAVAGSCR